MHVLATRVFTLARYSDTVTDRADSLVHLAPVRVALWLSSTLVGIVAAFAANHDSPLDGSTIVAGLFAFPPFCVPILFVWILLGVLMHKGPRFLWLSPFCVLVGWVWVHLGHAWLGMSV